MKTDAEQKIIDDVKEHGWHVMKVMEEAGLPPFAYSIGFFENYRHPEIIVFGLDLDLMHAMINFAGQDIKNGKRFESRGFYSDLIASYDCWFTDVPVEHCSKAGWAVWYYKNRDFPLRQCIWPTTQGIYPWEKDYPKDLHKRQPILGDISTMRD